MILEASISAKKAAVQTYLLVLFKIILQKKSEKEIT